MNLNGDDVGAGHEITRRNGRAVVGDRFVIHQRIARGEGEVIDPAARHVAAENFGAVEMHHRPVIAQHAHIQRGEGRIIRHHQGAAEIRRDVFRTDVPTKTHDRALVAVAVAELRRAVAPPAVIEPERRPPAALVAAVVEILPDRTGGDERDVRGEARDDRDADRRAGAARAAVVRGNGREAVAAGQRVRPGDAERADRVGRELRGVRDILNLGDGPVRIGGVHREVDWRTRDKDRTGRRARQRDDGREVRRVRRIKLRARNEFLGHAWSGPEQAGRRAAAVLVVLNADVVEHAGL